jgi:signal transduction histidine kinase/ActR/RegA family two-component response regulator
MTLRSRVLINIALVLLLLVGGLAASAERVLDMYRSLAEREEASAHLERAEAALADRLEHRFGTVVDYARWDESWQFVSGVPIDYAELAFGDAALDALDADAVIIRSFDGRYVSEVDPLELVDDATWAAWHVAWGGEGVSGFLLHNGAVWMVASHPVARTDGTGALIGAFTTVRRCDEDYLGEIGRLTLTDVALTAGSGEPLGLRMTGPRTLEIRAAVPTLDGDADLIVQAPRPIAALTSRTRSVLLAVSLGGGLLFTLLAMWFFDRRVMVPIERMRREVVGIMADPTAGRRVTPPQVGNISLLAKAFNELLAQFERQRAVLIEAKQAAEASAQAKSRFLATMSHEIRTPLHAILGTIEVLRRAPLQPVEAELVADQNTAASSLLALLNDVLDFAKIDAGHLDLASDPYDLAEVVLDASRVVGPLARHKQLRLTVTGTFSPVVTRGDRHRVRQVLLNLLGNAVKFTPAGGEVELALRRVDDTWVVEVRDTGIGIAPDHLSKIFQPFSQVESGAARRFGGTGLGLAISRELSVRMGGTLEVDSRVGEGSTFRLALPALAATLPACAAEAPSGGPLRVLVAEDNPLNQKITRLLLEREGHQVEVVANGEEVVERALAEPFDLVLMDLQMPLCDGFEATARLRQAGSGVRIVAFSANTSQDDRDACRAAGMDDHLSKPVDGASLRRVLHDARRAAAEG